MLSIEFWEERIKCLKDGVGNYTIHRCKADYPILFPLKVEAWCLHIKLVLTAYRACQE